MIRVGHGLHHHRHERECGCGRRCGLLAIVDWFHVHDGFLRMMMPFLFALLPLIYAALVTCFCLMSCDDVIVTVMLRRYVGRVLHDLVKLQLLRSALRDFQ